MGAGTSPGQRRCGARQQQFLQASPAATLAPFLCCAGKFYVFDTGSDPPMEPVLEDLIASGLVHYSYLTNTTTQVKLEAPPPGRSFNWQVRGRGAPGWHVFHD